MRRVGSWWSDEEAKMTGWSRVWRALVLSAAVAAVPACTKQAEEPVSAPPAAPVTVARLKSADGEPGNWLLHGRTHGEQRFSPLDAINDGNVGELGLACRMLAARNPRRSSWTARCT
jgi:glucose dehydrogenase